MAKDKKKAIDEDLVRALARLLDELDLAELEYGENGWHVRVAKGGRAVPVVAAAEAGAEVEAGGADEYAHHPGVVTSPMVGVAYLSEEEGGPPLIGVGDQIEEGQTLLLIEAMKVFNPIKAPRSGKVAKILIGNGTPVEFGEPLLIIE